MSNGPNNKAGPAHGVRGAGARGYLNREAMPDPKLYYQNELTNLHGTGQWRGALCCFHDDKTPSLSVNMVHGGFKCFTCHARGGDVLDFQMKRYGQTFSEAARELGAWRHS